MPRARAAAPEVETRTLLITEGNGKQFKVTIPADYKVTFSGFQQGGRYPDGTSALRIYEAENKQRACFVGVRSFHDLSLPITRLVVAENGESRWEDDGEGNATRTESRKRSVREVPA